MGLLRPPSHRPRSAPATARVTAAAAVLDKAAIETRSRAARSGRSRQSGGRRTNAAVEKFSSYVNARLQKSERRNNRDLVLIREYLERLDKRNATVQRAIV